MAGGSRKGWESDSHTAEVRAAVISTESPTLISEKLVVYRCNCAVSVRQGFSGIFPGML